MEGIDRRRAINLGLVAVAGTALAACGRDAAPPGKGAAAPHRAAPFRPVRVAARTKPAYRVHDLLTKAPANAVALTIDDGPDPKWTPHVLRVLAQHDVTATFSMIGVQVRRFPDLARHVVEAGHTVCNHSMHHPQPFADLTPARIKAEITGAHREIWKATGVTSRLFRAPGGSWSPTVLRTAANNGMVPLDWDIDPKDWARPGAAFIKTHLLRARPGDILLCHDGGGDRRQTLRALKTVIPALQHRGLSFVTL
jgi:peptidoglycan/xylan/chitin deacetylase (PgdA/CDA1 family)